MVQEDSIVGEEILVLRMSILEGQGQVQVLEDRLTLVHLCPH